MAETVKNGGRYEQMYNGEWKWITKKNHRTMCCDCCLVHREEYRIVDGKRIDTRCWRDNKATYKARKRAGIKIVGQRRGSSD